MGSPGLASGVRVGEVRPESAIVWVRLTARRERLRDGRGFADLPAEPSDTKKGKKGGKKRRRLELPQDWRVDELEGFCQGVGGTARVVYSLTPDVDGGASTPWQPALAASDFVIQFPLAGLRPGTAYHYRVETRSPSGDPGATFAGRFRTAGAGESTAPVSFTVVTGMMYRDLDDPRGFHIYSAMGALEPDFLVATGDTVYYDSEWPRARGVPLARYHWQRMYSLPRIAAFHGRVPGYWIKDDHDTFDDDCWPGRESKKVSPLTFAQGQAVFREQVPMGARTYRSVRWGKHLQVWFVEGRDFRSPNPAADGPGKTIWGEEQKRWLRETLLKSDATFRVLLSATPIVGPDRPEGKSDNHSNAAFHHEGESFRRWARDHLPDRFYVVCGDRHWQYHSVDPVTGVQEFSCGPASDEHAAGTPGLDPRLHRFHRVKGGFLSVSTGEEHGRPFIAFRHHDVHGGVVHEHREEAVESSLLDVPLASLAAQEEVGASKLLYHGLLELAREKLDARAAAVAELRDPAAIHRRRETIRRRIADSFDGFPVRTELNAHVVGRIERDDHVIEKVIYESRPGFHVTANLYLPRAGSAPWPVILLPCGHSKNGKAGRTYQTACQEFARRGFAAFIYDPIGQGERFQFLDEHGRPRVGGTTEHTLTGTAALLVGSNVAAVIIWDGIRAVDYLETRSDIDLSRLGCTGNSGGGTQTSYLMALEPRLRAAAPACYLTSMRRLLETIGPQDAEQNFTGFIAAGLDHADFVHAFAPRPALICAVTEDFFDIGGTWTTFREAKRIYGRLGHPGAIDLIEIDAKHGYHPPIRQRVGRFFERTLMGRSSGSIVASVEEGVVYPDEELQCTETGQVVSALDGRTVADLWRELEADLCARREARFGDMSRDEWLRGVRRLAAMAHDVAAPSTRSLVTTTVAGVAVEKLVWGETWPVVALLLGPAGRVEWPTTRTANRAVEIVVADDGPLGAMASCLLGRARAGETILAVALPGYGPTTPSNPRAGWGRDWQEAFLAFHLGLSLAGIRADALRQAVRLVGERFGGAAIHVRGIGAAAQPALLGAVMEPGVGHLRLEHALESWASIVADGLHRGRLGNVVPGALEHFDLPLLRRAMAPREVEFIQPEGPHGKPLENFAF